MKVLSTSGFMLSVFLFWAISDSISLAQPMTSSGLNTTVSAPITLPSSQTQFNITGGTRPGGGANLFHSFGDFNVPNNNIANFLNNSGLATSNILGRVTGGNPSNIFGNIQTTGFGNANLFLINPAGFLFGPNATLNVGGMMTFTSADYLRLSDNARFNAIPRTAPDLLLSAAPVAAFGFLGSNPGAITVQGSHLSVADGTGIALVGGNITVQAGTLTAPSGQINLVSVGKPSHPNVGGEVVISGSGQGAGFNPTGFKNMGDVTLTQGSVIDTSVIGNSGHSAGGVLIRGGEFVMNDSSIKAEFPTHTFNVSNPSVGGNIEITVEHINISNNSRISTSNVGFGSAGDITFNADTFSATDSAITAAGGFLSSESGSVTIQGLHGSGSSAHSAFLTNTGISTSNNGLPSCPGFCNTSGGPILIQADNIGLKQSSLNAFSVEQNGGSITLVSNGRIESHDSSLTASAIWGAGGTVDLRAGKTIDFSDSTISARSSFMNSGTIILSAPRISIKGGGLNVGTQGNSPAGTISITGEKAVSLSGTHLTADGLPVGEGPNAPPLSGNGGTILINGGTHFTSEQSTLSAQSAFKNGGTIHIDANKVSLTDSQLTTSVSGGPQTVGGHITVDAKNVTVKNSQILSAATEGQGGTIGITSHVLHQAGSVIDASSQSGTDGTVSINGIIQP